MADVYGVETPDMGEVEPGFQAIEACVMLKGLTREGEITLVIVTSDGLTPWEILGMAEMLRDDIKVNSALINTTDEDDEF